LRAALRAKIGIGNLRLLLPMISDLGDVEQALLLLDQAERQLVEEGFVTPGNQRHDQVPSAICKITAGATHGLSP
jgi:phosphotransferase system enzyme I (PtsP)